MAWNVPLVARRPKAVSPRSDASPVVMRRVSGCLVIEVRGAIGPAAEARIGRVLHGAIRPGGTGVVVDLRHVRDLGVSGLSVLRLARLLAAQRGVAFGFAGELRSVPELPPG
ncbi:STAS domain-containing protein [Streptomyces endophyticus]|uniref:STAS domain-containing protein n=1 Tax=Streptomyces endophyticus TaxID=714166 RepID=A0ABU6F2N5_9ACTN|nr:STAS domain-containing protein [Streptomyces endophyticus]MEB8337171.1 STAS domain-containing protein [Streptomyces endophyticus]